jgi:hypothetical protein
MFQVCPMHADEAVTGLATGDGTELFTCTRNGHVLPGPFTWTSVPERALEAGDGIIAEYGLLAELKDAIRAISTSRWIEFGLVERQYARSNPDDFEALVARYRHTAFGPKRYTVSALIGLALGMLARNGAILTRQGRATGYWKYNPTILWTALGPVAPGWPAESISWESTGYLIDYVPGAPTFDNSDNVVGNS